jgi:hypothetical protein
MNAPASQRCGALAEASVATEATLNYADNNRQSCNISDRLLNEVDGYHRQAVQARNNVCAGRPIRSYPPDIIQCGSRQEWRIGGRRWGPWRRRR